MSLQSSSILNQSSNALKKNKSGIDLMKNYLLKKAENLYKLNLSDE